MLAFDFLQGTRSMEDLGAKGRQRRKVRAVEESKKTVSAVRKAAKVAAKNVQVTHHYPHRFTPTAALRGKAFRVGSGASSVSKFSDRMVVILDDVKLGEEAVRATIVRVPKGGKPLGNILKGMAVYVPTDEVEASRISEGAPKHHFYISEFNVEKVDSPFSIVRTVQRPEKKGSVSVSDVKKAIFKARSQKSQT